MLAPAALLQRHRPTRALPAAAVFGLLGAGMALAQRGPAPSTHPDPPSESTGSPAAPSLVLPLGDLQLFLRPTLEFHSTSPDRFWTLFAALRQQPQPTCTMEGDPWTAAVDLDIRCRLDEPVWSHLNSYTAFDVTGHRELSVAFSPVPDLRIALEPMDYPVGRPATFAWVDRRGVFRVARARSAEKGPYTEVGAGPLAPDDALTILLYDLDVAVAEITLHDFARHASTEPSPTAGWRVPQNAVQFARAGELPADVASFWITLAGTGPGRGFQSVAHAPGEYRNRIRVRRLP